MDATLLSCFQADERCRDMCKELDMEKVQRHSLQDKVSRITFTNVAHATEPFSLSLSGRFQVKARSSIFFSHFPAFPWTKALLNRMVRLHF